MATTDELNIVISADTGNAAQNISNTANELNRLGESAKTTDGDMSALVRAMSEVAANMVSVSQNISASAAGVAGFHNGFDALSGTLQDISAKFDTLNVSIQNTSFGDAASRVAELSAASEASAQALNGISAAADDFGAHMGTISEATKGSADGMDALKNELNGALSSIRNFSGDMSTAGAEAQETAAKIKELSEQINKIPKGNNVADLTKSFKTLKGVIATLGIGAFIKQSNDAYNVQMQNELKLTSHMKHRMNATEEEIQSIKDLTAAQQKLGVIGDEIQLAGAQQLTTYARQSSTLKTLIPAMNNLIAQNAGYEASVGDATSAADTLGRALNGQYTALQRQGVYFTKAQEQVLKYGTEEQKAIVLADAINSKVGNMNQLLAQTPTGQLKQLQNDFGDLQEEIGATFQPLISSFVPIVRGGMEMLREPIKNVSVGIAVLGSALARLDSPAVRAIALTAAGIAVVNKLRLALGGTTALLLVAGVLLSGFIGSMQEEQASIGDYVNDAFNGAQDAIGGAEESMNDFKDEVNDTQKAVNRLAGFDTLTKLSGNGSAGSLVAGLIGDSDIDKIYAMTDAVSDLNGAFDSIGVPNISVDTSRLADASTDIQEFVNDAVTVFTHWGDDEAVYEPLNRMTNKIEGVLNAAGLDGTGFVDFWKGIGAKFQTNWIDALDEIDKKFVETFGDVGETWSGFWRNVGASYSDFINSAQAFASGDMNTAFSLYFQAQSRSPVWSEDQQDALRDLAKNISENDAQGTVISADNFLTDARNVLSGLNDIIVNAQQANPLYHNYSDIGLDWSGMWQNVGKGLFNTQVAAAEAYNSVFSLTPAENEVNSQPSRYDVPLSPTGIPSYVPKDNITVNLNVDGETLATKTIDIQNNETVESNGYYG